LGTFSSSLQGGDLGRIICVAMAKELRALPPLYFRDIDQPQIDFVYERRGLKSTVPPYAFHVAASHAA
jgi:hypothetical protein